MSTPGGSHHPAHGRLLIVSFRVGHGSHHLHAELVVAGINDLFGIQARAACAPALRAQVVGHLTGRTPTVAQLDLVEPALLPGAKAHGFDTELWTLGRIADTI
jgi:hypothetical protein